MWSLLYLKTRTKELSTPAKEALRKPKNLNKSIWNIAEALEAFQIKFDELQEGKRSPELRLSEEKEPSKGGHGKRWIMEKIISKMNKNWWRDQERQTETSKEVWTRMVSSTMQNTAWYIEYRLYKI